MRRPVRENATTASRFSRVVARRTTTRPPTQWQKEMKQSLPFFDFVRRSQPRLRRCLERCRCALLPSTLPPTGESDSPVPEGHSAVVSFLQRIQLVAGPSMVKRRGWKRAKNTHTKVFHVVGHNGTIRDYDVGRLASFEAKAWSSLSIAHRGQIQRLVACAPYQPQCDRQRDTIHGWMCDQANCLVVVFFALMQLPDEKVREARR